jgi:hypothetical protein
MIPAEDVIRTIDEATQIVADAVRSEGERKLREVNTFANQIADEQKRKHDTLESNYRETLRTGGRLLQDASARADRQIKRAVKVAAAARAQTSKARERARQAMSFAEAIAQHMNA